MMVHPVIAESVLHVFKEQGYQISPFHTGVWQAYLLVKDRWTQHTLFVSDGVAADRIYMIPESVLKPFGGTS